MNFSESVFSDAVKQKSMSGKHQDYPEKENLLADMQKLVQ